jgi:3-oxoacyl-[acyl-carrier protein] reductase
MDLGITGKRALVCGGSAGMGKAIAQTLAKEGARVFVCARSPYTLAEAVTDIKQSATAPVESATCDLSDPASRKELIAKVQKIFGGVDILVHNSGGPQPSTAEDTSTQDFQKGFESLFQSVIELNAAFVPGMKQQKWGRIINVTSLSVLEPIGNLAVSNAIRSAATAMLKTLADELAPFNITVNCVAPGAISTGRIEELIEVRAKKANISKDAYFADYVKAIPAQRLGTPEEFASVVGFLASEPASYVTGSTICIDGGKRRSTY